MRRCRPLRDLNASPILNGRTVGCSTPDRTVVVLSGHKPGSVFYSNNIVAEDELARSIGKIFDDLAAQPRAPATLPREKKTRGRRPLKNRRTSPTLRHDRRVLGPDQISVIFDISIT